MKTTLLAIGLGLIVGQPAIHAQAQAAPASDANQTEVAAEDQDDVDTAEEADKSDNSTIFIVDSPVPGSATVIGSKALTDREPDDIHKAVRTSGVYFREEDGFGLRPNIGMRGSGTNRSSKITLMEDGILIAPAPYSAPAAYFFPLVTRMSAIEIEKGVSTLRYGPATVGGAVNMLSAPLPETSNAMFDLAAGSFGTIKEHGLLNLRSGMFGAQVEAVKLYSQGFKRLDGGGGTGFDKNEVSAKVFFQDDLTEKLAHQAMLRFGYADELSRETYLGISTTDFRQTPNRRYAATQLDTMEWQHWRAQAQYHWEYDGNWQGNIDAYWNGFDRTWLKIDDFAGGRSLAEVLRDPAGGINQALYQVLTGQRDSSGGLDDLLLGTNARQFSAGGLSIDSSNSFTGWGGYHTTGFTVRLHRDKVKRNHTQQTVAMRSGALELRNIPPILARLSVGSATALSGQGQIQTEWSHGVTSTVGIRVETINNFYQDNIIGDEHSDWYMNISPGAGVVWKMSDYVSILAGLHGGFVPQPPSLSDVENPEVSTNYELGARALLGPVEVQTIGFYSDYENLQGTCTISSGCDPSQVGLTFDGGRVWTYGVEANARTSLQLSTSMKLPISVDYTFTGSSFRSAFASNNPLWGSVSVGDELPYLPKHIVYATVGLESNWWHTAVDFSYSSAMRDSAGQGPIAPEDKTDPYVTVDLNGWVQWQGMRFYGSLTNVLNRRSIVSRRPFGARPNKPRAFMLGMKLMF